MADTPSRRPRELLEHPTEFGREPEARWRRAKSLEEASKVAGAMEQHRLSIAVRRLMRRHRNKTADVAAALGQSTDQLWRKLAGHAPARPGDLILWAWLADERTSAPPLDELLVRGSKVAVPEWPLEKLESV